MAITFALRGDSLTPRYNAGRPEVGKRGVTAPSSSADASAIGGQSIDMDTGLFQNHGLHYSGYLNWPSTQTVSILIRAKFSAFGTNQALFNCAGSTRANPGQFSSFLHGGTSEVRCYMTDENGATGINNASFGVHSLSTDTWYDLVWTFTGDTTTDGAEHFQDAVSFGTLTSTRSWSNPREPVYNDFALQLSENVTTGRWFVNEVVIWDEIIDPTSITLTDGSGSLNGASRTTFVEVDEFDGSASNGGSKAGLGLPGIRS